MKQKQTTINEIKEHRVSINNASLRYLFNKRLFDLIISSLAIILLSFILLAISLWIKIRTKGAVLYSEERCGLRGKRYHSYVFVAIIKRTAIRKLPLLFTPVAGRR
jgi:lipopolysaccharide/colanic/teichoic acid biosynthesis glycosyltransferase